MSVLQVDTIQDSAGTTNKELAQYSSGNWSWGSGIPTGTIENQTVIKYAFANNGSYTNEGTTEKVATRKNGDDTAVESISVIGGYTYIYTYNYWSEIWRNSGGDTSQRYGKIRLCDDATNRTQGDSSYSWTLAYDFVGRNMYAAQGSTNTSYIFTSIKGAYSCCSCTSFIKTHS